MPIAAPGALIGASNFFELAVATAIALYGPGSGAALATVVGVLVEVPVMLSVCRMCVATRRWFPATPAEKVHRNDANHRCPEAGLAYISECNEMTESRLSIVTAAAKALGHPARVRVLAMLSGGRSASARWPPSSGPRPRPCPSTCGS